MSSSFFKLFSRLRLAGPSALQTFKSPSTATAALPASKAGAAPMSLASGSTQKRAFTSTPQLAKKGKKRGGVRGQGPDRRLRNLKLSNPRKVPPPLRFARNRALRHWTIHRAWLLYQRKERHQQETELQKMYQSMKNACEELRKTSGPGPKSEGYLYRVAMEKKGVWTKEAIPIEYARFQTETPAKKAWDHDWTR